MGRRIREYDWSKTSLGPVENWPQNLLTCIRIMLTSMQPIWIGWGKDLIKFYNDPYISIVGGKHPWALGCPASMVWKEICDKIEPMLKQVMEKDEGTYVESQLLIMVRNGYPEETYYTFSYTPVPGDKGYTEGMICANTEDTQRIIGERQLKTLQDLGNLETTRKSVNDVYEAAAEALRKNNKDFPFGIIYQINNNGTTAEPAAWIGIDEDQAVFPKHIDLTLREEGTLNFCKAFETKQIVVSENNGRRKNLPTGAWATEATHFIHIPIVSAAGEHPHAIFSAALNPYRRYDDSYKQFTKLVADQIAIEINIVLAYQEERKRAEALAELDRAKTTFFSNISHEFRTPLTLLLGPIEDALNDPNTIPANKVRLDIAQRNSLRLQKLVNNLLDFSRIEAKRVKADLLPKHIDTLTKDIVSSFGPVIEKSGIDFVVDCPPLKNQAAIDADMWENIVLNLVSNAYKYTNSGTIKVQLTEDEKNIELSVSDTGIGIAKEELAKIFERFHRVENVQGRTQEGTGIGLSLVKELVKLHNGEINVKSEVGKGSVFTVSIPVYNGDHKQNTDGATNFYQTNKKSAFIEEAKKWSAQNADAPAQNKPSAQNKLKPKILVADDNADMRDYIQRLLHKDYEVRLANDGEDAFEKVIREIPDLVVSDVMMPKLSGLGLLSKLRAHDKTKNIPFIFLSARAGEEAKLEGLESGADDYLVKPFSAKELIVKIEANIRIAKNRQAAERNLYNLFMQSPVGIVVLSGEQLVIELVNDTMLQYWRRHRDEAQNKPIWDVLPEVQIQGFDKILAEAFRTGKNYVSPETGLQILNDDKLETIYVRYALESKKDEFGNIVGLFGIAYDVTHQVMARKKIEESEEQLKIALEGAELGFYDYYPQTDKLFWSDKAKEIFDVDADAQFNYKTFMDRIHPDDREQVTAMNKHAFIFENGGAYENEYRILDRHGKIKWLKSKGKVYFDTEHKPVRFSGIVQDVTIQRAADLLIKESEEKLRQLADSMPQMVWAATPDGYVDYFNKQWYEFSGLPEANGEAGWLLALHPDDRDAALDLWRSSIPLGEPFQHEMRFKEKRTGLYKWFLGKAVPIKDADGNILRWYGTITDIDMHKKLSENLEKLVAERTMELQRSNEDLQQFAHVASHDLKEPVRKIRTFGDRLINDYGGILPDKGKLYISKMEESAKRMNAMIDGVLQYSLLDGMEIKMETVNLNEIIKSIENDLEVVISEKKAVIAYRELASIQGSPILIYQLFYNLISNSLKFTRPDIAPVIQIESSTIKFNGEDGKDGRQHGEYFQITINDNGIGFRQAFAQDIFKTFLRLNTKDKYEGTGLGLSLCKKIVERHRGFIRAEGRDGDGATFFVTIPKI